MRPACIHATGNYWQLVATVTQQRDLNLIGSATRPMAIHTAAEMALCRSKADAALLAVRHSDLSQDAIAARMPMDPGHLSRLISGRRPWNDRWTERFERITSSYALTQWEAKKRGGEFYADPVRVERAQLQQRLAELDREAA